MAYLNVIARLLGCLHSLWSWKRDAMVSEDYVLIMIMIHMACYKRYLIDWLVVYEPGSVGQGIWPDLLLCFRSPTSRLGRSEHFYIKCHLFLILLAVNNDVVNLYICSLLFVVAVCPFIVVCHPFVVYSLSMVENETSWQQNCTLPTTRRPRSVQLEVPGMA